MESYGSEVNQIDLSGDMVYLRLHDKICLRCFSENWLKLDSIIKIRKEFSIKIIGSYKHEETLIRTLESIGLSDCDILYVPNDKLYLTADRANAPYLFLVENDKIMHVHFFSKESSNTIISFLEAMERLRE